MEQTCVDCGIETPGRMRCEPCWIDGMAEDLGITSKQFIKMVKSPKYHKGLADMITKAIDEELSKQ